MHWRGLGALPFKLSIDKYDALMSQAIREFMTQLRDTSLSTWSVQEGVLRQIRSLQ